MDTIRVCHWETRRRPAYPAMRAGESLYQYQPLCRHLLRTNSGFLLACRLFHQAICFLRVFLAFRGMGNVSLRGYRQAPIFCFRQKPGCPVRRSGWAVFIDLELKFLVGDKRNMPRAGLEPAWPLGRNILSVARIPIPPPGPVLVFSRAARPPASLPRQGIIRQAGRQDNLMRNPGHSRESMSFSISF